jgi:hypothetical protein
MFDLPLEYAPIGFKDAKFSGKIVPELLDLAQRGIVRFVDFVFLQKEADGSTRTLELNDLEPETYEMFVPVGERVSSLFTNDDLEIAASRLPHGSAAVLILWENLWVANLRKAVAEQAASWWSASRSRPRWWSSSYGHSRRSSPESRGGPHENPRQAKRHRPLPLGSPEG